MSQLSIETIKELHRHACYSSLAYKSDTEGRKAFKNLDVEHIMFFSGKTTQVFVGKDSDGCIVVSFRGTEPTSMPDILTDVQHAKRECAGCKVHEGFLLGSDEVCLELFSLLKRTASNGEKIIINGHSLGGALAMLFGFRLKSETDIANEVVISTFGQPKVGDKKFTKKTQKLFSSNYRRVVNDKDIVPHLPTYLVMDYDHSDKVYFIDDKPSISLQPEGYDLREHLKDSFLGISKAVVLPNKTVLNAFLNILKEAIGDHSIDQYIDFLDKIIRRYDEN